MESASGAGLGAACLRRESRSYKTAAVTHGTAVTSLCCHMYTGDPSVGKPRSCTPQQPAGRAGLQDSVCLADEWRRQHSPSLPTRTLP